jgi:hypothetical protein
MFSFGLSAPKRKGVKGGSSLAAMQHVAYIAGP